ncbi:MAG: carbohydrate ABC transporter permease [Deinococcales bacterium]
MTRARRRLLGRILFWVLVAAILVYLLFPFYWALNSALKTQRELIQTPATFWPEQLAMTMFPQIAVLAGLYAVIRVLGMPAIPSMILSYMLFTLPFTVWVLTSFFKGLPVTLLQAAQVDGATMMQSFRMVLLPLTAPALVTTGLLAFIQAWNEYLFALTFTVVEPKARTVPVAIALFTGEVARQEPFGEIMAGAVVVTIPLVILVLLFQQRIVAGLTAGAVKG